MEASIEALQMEIIITSITRITDVPDLVIRAIRIHEQWILTQAVLIGKSSRLPGSQGSPIGALPIADYPGLGRVDEIVITGETHLAIIRNPNSGATFHPDNVVPKTNVLRPICNIDGDIKG